MIELDLQNPNLLASGAGIRKNMVELNGKKGSDSVIVLRD